jgi:hypothetical protein
MSMFSFIVRSVESVLTTHKTSNEKEKMREKKKKKEKKILRRESNLEL